MKGIISFVALTLAINCAEGLKCYNCAYLDNKLPSSLALQIPAESSCKPGKKPDKKLLVDCSNIIYNRSGSNGTGALNMLTNVLGDDSPLLVAPNQVNGTNFTYTYTCAKLSYDGDFVPRHSGSKMKAMFRSCIRKYVPTNTTFQQQCQAGKMDKVNIQDSYVRANVFNMALGPYMNHSKTDVSICTCNKDECNGALENAQISIFLMIVGIVGILFRQI
ncbi:unnamed protein product [Orchesella dallaii]|uniref:Protein quiver n=1 Tax=Orchesella dallaii TaxID=48710 RepID=A0ABP1PWC7_9HEXA